MARSYKAPNGRIIPRGRGGRFRRASFGEFVGYENVSPGEKTCGNCGEKWIPLVRTGICPKCGSQEGTFESEVKS